MKIIFLDIDGVLNVTGQHGRDEYGSNFHPHLVDNLRLIIGATGAKVVISSTWRMSGLQEMQIMWEMRDLPGEVIDVTPVFNTPRGEEIEFWLQHNQVDAYVILDDDSDMLPEQTSCFVKCSDNRDHEDCVDIGYGLTKRCAIKAIDILNHKI